MYKNIKIREVYLVYLIFIVDKDTWEIQEKNSQVPFFFPQIITLYGKVQEGVWHYYIPMCEYSLWMKSAIIHT